MPFPERVLALPPVSRARLFSSTIGLLVLCAILIGAWPTASGETADDAGDLAASALLDDAAAPPVAGAPLLVPTACLTRVSSEPLCPTGRLVVPELFRPPTALSA